MPAGIAITFTIILIGGAAAFAQPKTANPIAAAVVEGWNSAKGNLAESAKLMPEDGYSFRPVETVRTFGQILAHVAGANYEFCAAARGEKTPYAEDYFEKSAKTKAEIVKALDGSIAYCDQAFTSATDASLAQMIPEPFGGKGQTARLSALAGNTGHVNEHYGNLVTYFRIKGMVPPSSAPRR